MQDVEQFYADVVARTLRAERAAAGITQKEMAENCDIARATYLRYESGERRISAAQTMRVAEALGISFAELARRIEMRLETMTPVPQEPDFYTLAANTDRSLTDRERWALENDHDEPA